MARVEHKTSPKIAKAFNNLRKLPAFSLADAKAAGLSQPTVSRLLQRGVLVRVGPRLYQFSDADFDPESADYMIATKLFGAHSVIGGLTALFHYGLIDDVPEQIWVLVPPTVRTTANLYRIVRTTRNLSHGIKRHAGYKMVDIERAIIDAFIYGSKVGMSRGIACAIRALRDKKTTEKRIFELAERMGVLDKIARHWDIITIAVER
jgi:predicted transcriptional regulator of viral defense system